MLYQIVCGGGGIQLSYYSIILLLLIGGLRMVFGVVVSKNHISQFYSEINVDSKYDGT